jgi:hypothetical protein
MIARPDATGGGPERLSIVPARAHDGGRSVQQPMDFPFVIHFQTAQALSLTIPQHVLLQATEVIQEGLFGSLASRRRPRVGAHRSC